MEEKRWTVCVCGKLSWHLIKQQDCFRTLWGQSGRGCFVWLVERSVEAVFKSLLLVLYFITHNTHASGMFQHHQVSLEGECESFFGSKWWNKASRPTNDLLELPPWLPSPLLSPFKKIQSVIEVRSERTAHLGGSLVSTRPLLSSTFIHRPAGNLGVGYKLVLCHGSSVHGCMSECYSYYLGDRIWTLRCFYGQGTE